MRHWHHIFTQNLKISGTNHIIFLVYPTFNLMLVWYHGELTKVTLCSFNKITVALSFSPRHRNTNHALIHSRCETKGSHFNPNTYITTRQYIHVKSLPNTRQLQVGASNKLTGMGVCPLQVVAYRQIHWLGSYAYLVSTTSWQIQGKSLIQFIPRLQVATSREWINQTG